MPKDYTVAGAKQFTARELYELLENLDLKPPYQRSGEVWESPARSLFIDSLANGFAVPTLYLHQFIQPQVDGKRRITHAVVDGKQRLMTIKRFFDGELQLAGDFRFYEDAEGIEISPAAGKRFQELEGPGLLQVKTAIIRAQIPVVEIRSASENTIRKMFRRLNSQGKLNAAEFRNSFPGEFPPMTWDAVKHPFMAETLRLETRRYKHYDVAGKFLAVQDLGPATLRKNVIDDWAEQFDPENKDYHGRGHSKKVLAESSKTMDRLQAWFVDLPQNPVLKKDGTLLPIYMLAMDAYHRRGGHEGQAFAAFKALLDVTVALLKHQDELEGFADRVIEFSNLQRRNERKSFERRREILTEFADAYKLSEDLHDWLGISKRKLNELAAA